jgi:phenylacetate-CoA ligase
LISRLKYLAHRLARPLRYRYLKPLLVNESLGREQLRLYQQQQFNAMVRYATQQTDFYREKYRGIAGPDFDLSHVDPERLPVLTKQEVIEQRETMVAGGLDQPGLKPGYTGGSTGKPLAFYYTDEKIERMRAGMMRSYRWAGWQQGDKVLNFWGSRHQKDNKTRKHRKPFDRLRRFAAAEQTLGAYAFNEADLLDWARHVQRWRPTLLQGYASILAELALFVQRKNMRMPATIKGVFSTAEVLYDWQRAAIESAFSCTVYNQYGCREVPNIGLQCSQGNFHIFSDLVKLESVPVDGEHRLLVTSLTNRVMPMIRYELGDLGRLKTGQCGCGSPFPLLELDVCRSNDIMITPGGRRIYPSYFVHLLDGHDGIRKFQFVQTGPGEIVLKLCARQELADVAGAALKPRLQADLGGDMRLQVECVEDIPRSRSGKHRFVIGLRDITM